MLLYLPPYSPDLNPIEDSFSTCTLFNKVYFSSFDRNYEGKAFIRRNGAILRNEEDPILMLLGSTGCITGEMAEGWFRHAGYIVG